MTFINLEHPRCVKLGVGAFGPHLPGPSQYQQTQLHRKGYKTEPTLLPCETALSTGREISTKFPAGTTEEQLFDTQQGQLTLHLTLL